jgi:predicted hydrocarbon binding protein
MFDFLEERYGYPMVAMIGRRFQVHPLLFSQENGWMNNLFFTDMYSYLEESFKLPKNFYYDMGRHSTQVNANTELGFLYRELRKVKSVYERLFGEFAPFYEKNSTYQILKLSETHCTIRTRTKREVAQALDVKNLGSPAICQWKAGIFAAAPNYLGLADSNPRELKCVHRGDPFCVFEIFFGHLPKQPLFEC